jgi:O-antigen ligase
MKLTLHNTDITDIRSGNMFLFELPFWIIFFFWSFFPDIKTPKFEILAIPINSKDLAIIIAAYMYIFLPGITNYSNDENPDRNWHCHLPILSAVLLVYAAFSIDGNKMDESDFKAMLYTLLLTASSFFLGYILLAKMSVQQIRSFLWRLTLVLAALGLLYTAASFLSLGVGDVRESLNSQEQEFGMVRVAGPLFVAAKGFFILIPALAFAIQEYVQSRENRLLKLAVVFVLTLTIIGLGSRAGLLILAAFFILMILFMQNKKQAAIASFLMILLTSIAVFLVFSRANPERIQSLEDLARQGTYQTSFQIITNRSLELNLLGSGYGSYWPWYLTDARGYYRLAGGGFYLLYPFGYLLYHPHSTFLLLIVELGFLGLFYFLYLWSILIKIIIRNLRNPIFPIFACGMFASGLSMFFDFFIFKDAQTNVLWWIFLLGLLALSSGTESLQIQFIEDRNE